MEAAAEAGKNQANAETRMCRMDASRVSITSVELKWDILLSVAKRPKRLTLIAVQRAGIIPDVSFGCAKVVTAASSNVG